MMNDALIPAVCVKLTYRQSKEQRQSDMCQIRMNCSVD